MISSRCNDNFDEFPGPEIEKSYRTFLGKPVFVNHNNEDHRRARGVIIDAALHQDANPDGTPDTWVEGLQEIDALTFPKLARAIVLGHIDRTSMGVDVEHSICSTCSNKATTPLEYCRHIPGQKGLKFMKRMASGESVAELIREKCYGLSFFENSLLVEEPADPTAYFLGSVERGPGLDHLVAKTAVRGRTMPTSASSLHGDQSMADLGLVNIKITAGGKCPACTSLNTVASARVVNCFDCDHRYLLSTEARLHADEPMSPLTPHKPVSSMDKGEQTEWNAKARDHGLEWNRRNPVHPDNIVDHWHAATDDEKHNGMNWYSDAHHTTAHIARDTETPVHTMAGLVSNFSPQTHWSTNIATAAKCARTKTALGGKGNKDGIPQWDEERQAHIPKGIMASAQQRDAAQSLLDGVHHSTVLKGPKTRAFAHLIEHGGDSPDDITQGKSRVCVDRHALSVAAGARASDVAYAHSGLGGKKKYEETGRCYQDAAERISDHEGHPVAPHQVQAVTWLTRQRLNEAHDREIGGRGSKAAGSAQTAIHHMQQYFGEHHPEASIQMPGTGYSSRNTPNKLEKIAYGLGDPDEPASSSRGRRGRH